MSYGLLDNHNSTENDIHLVLENPNQRHRRFQRTSSVILPFTGERVRQKINLEDPDESSPDDYDQSFESFNDHPESITGKLNTKLLSGGYLGPKSGSSTDMNGPGAGQSHSNGSNPEMLTELHPLLMDRQISIMNRIKILLLFCYNYIHDTYHHDDKLKNVLRCSIGYLIASLGVYWPPFNRLLGNSDFKHVVSTVVVYFHPSRTKGSMHITLLYVVISVGFSFSISFICRFISASVYRRGQEEVSYAIDLVFSSVSLGIVSFMKQKINKETFNTACSLAAISIVACIIKEGSMNGAIIPIDRLTSTLRVVVVGCLISITICYGLWPRSAEMEFKSDLNGCYNLMSSILSLITNKFLLGQKLLPADNEVFNKLDSRLASLDKHLQDSKYELFLKGYEKKWEYYCRLTSITNSLATHLKALRASTEMQYKLLQEQQKQQKIQEANEQLNRQAGLQVDTSSLTTRSRSPSVSTLKSYRSDLLISQSIENLVNINAETPNNDLDYVAINPGQIFDLFVYYLSPSMKAFIFTIKNILLEIPFDSSDQKLAQFAYPIKFQKSLSMAISLFDDKQMTSFHKLYNQDIFKLSTNGDENLAFKSNLETVTACCGNFSSLLQLFGKELLEFLTLLSVGNGEGEGRGRERREREVDQRTWNWIKVWKDEKPKATSKGHFTSDINDALFYLLTQYNRDPNKTRSDTERTGTRTGTSASRTGTSQGESFLSTYSYKLWAFLKLFKRTDIQFGIRVGLGAFVLSVFAFHPDTKILFSTWKGEWSLTIYCIMMNKSLGGTQMTAKWRFLGTFLGCLVAWVNWIVFDGHPIALGLVGFLLSIPCFYIIIYWKRNNAFGRFILLTYNLTALYSYTMEQHDSEGDEEGGDSPIISDIAFHRFISVSIGVIWAITMASVFIPNSARSRLKSGLTILWLRLGIIWNSDPLDYEYDPKTRDYKLISLKGDNGLNKLLKELEMLLKQAPLEFRLKGKFPTKKYECLIKYSSKIIDAFHNMILMIEVDPVLNRNEETVIKYIELERHELEHRIFLIFYMIASSMKLEFPIPNKPASTEHAKDRLLIKLNDIRSRELKRVNDGTKPEEVILSNEDYVLLYTYILVTSTITQELDKIIEILKELMGDISEETFQLV